MSSGAVAVAPPAKNVVVYRNGDPFFHGRKFVVSQRRFLTFEAFLNEVTGMIQAPVAVRNIYTPRYGHRVADLGELQNGQQYVAAGFERFKRLNYLHPEMQQMKRKWKKDDVRNYAGLSQRTPVSTSWKRQVNLPCIIYVFRNGDLLNPPFRVILSNSTLQDWNAVLRLLSEKTPLRTGSVRKLCRLNGEVVSRGEDLVSGGYYVAAGLEKYKNLPYVELLVPPKTVHQPFRNLPNLRRRNRDDEFGKLYRTSQDGSSDSALLELPPQLNLRQVQSTGVVPAENRSPRSLAMAPRLARKHPLKEKEPSVFHAKPVLIKQIKQNPHHGSYQERDEDSIYQTKGPRKETAGAQEIGEDEDTQVELPVDQTAAETVEEEVKPKMEVKPRRKVENDDKLQRAHAIWMSTGEGSSSKAPVPSGLEADRQRREITRLKRRPQRTLSG
nr:doublecortin domain-containing protein 2B [Pogona vitticeps]